MASKYYLLLGLNQNLQISQSTSLCNFYKVSIFKYCTIVKLSCHCKNAQSLEWMVSYVIYFYIIAFYKTIKIKWNSFQSISYTVYIILIWLGQACISKTHTSINIQNNKKKRCIENTGMVYL